MDSHKKFWFFVAVSALATIVVFTSLAALFWSQFTPEEQHQLIELVHRHMVYVVAMIVMFIGGWIVWLDAVLYTYVLPAVQIADEALIINTVNPSHRIRIDASQDMNRLVTLINEAADRYEELQNSVEDRIRAAREEVEKDKSILEAIFRQLPEGVIICNPAGSILLYNNRAQEVLTAPGEACNLSGTETLFGPFLGLGRNISRVIDPIHINRAFAEISDPSRHLSENPVSFFSITGPRGNLLSIEVVPLLDSRRQAAGYVLIIHDLSQTLTIESRRMVLHIQDRFREGLEHIRLAANFLSSDPLPTLSTVQDAVRQIRHQTDRMQEIILTSFMETSDFQTIAPITLTDTSRPEFYDFDLFNRPEADPEVMETLLTNLSYTVLDTETTGLDPEIDEIISLGAVRIVNNRLLQEDGFETLVDPKRPVGIESIRIHGIQPEALHGKPVITEVLAHFHRYAENTVLVGHNVAFDMRMFQMKESMSGLRFNHPVLDTMLLSALLNPAHRNHSLEAIAQRMGLCITGRHTARGDATATALIFLKFLPLLARRNILTLRDAIDASRKTYYARIRY